MYSYSNINYQTYEYKLTDQPLYFRHNRVRTSSITYTYVCEMSPDKIMLPGEDVCGDGLVLLDGGVDLRQVGAVARVRQHLDHLLQVALAQHRLQRNTTRLVLYQL